MCSNIESKSCNINRPKTETRIVFNVLTNPPIYTTRRVNSEDKKHDSMIVEEP